MTEVNFGTAFNDLIQLVISFITNAGHTINDLGRIGIAVLNLILSVFGAKIPEVITIANLEVSSGLFINLFIIGGAVWTLYKNYSKMVKEYLKLVAGGAGILIALSVVGAVL